MAASFDHVPLTFQFKGETYSVDCEKGEGSGIPLTIGGDRYTVRCNDKDLEQVQNIFNRLPLSATIASPGDLQKKLEAIGAKLLFPAPPEISLPPSIFRAAVSPAAPAPTIAAVASSAPTASIQPPVTGESAATSAIATTTSDAEKREKIAQFLEAVVKEKDFRGAVVVIKDGKPLFKEGYGSANLEGGKITDHTVFHLGSITKQFTAAAILLLEQNKTLNTSDSINTHLPPEFRNPKWNHIKIHDLLNHTSGLPAYGPDEEPKEYAVTEILNLFKESDLAFTPPGSAHLYSNAGYALLGAIIEYRSGKSYGEFIKERIFNEYAMGSSGFGSEYLDENAAQGAENQKMHLSKAYAAGALYSTIEDMQKWDKALYDDRFLTPASREKMFRATPTPVAKAPPEAFPKEYGYGVEIINDPTAGLIAFHEGHIPGFSTMILRMPTTHDCIVVLSNNGALKVDEIGFPIVNILFDIK